MRRRKLSFAHFKCGDLHKASNVIEITLHRPINANIYLHGDEKGLKEKKAILP